LKKYSLKENLEDGQELESEEMKQYMEYEDIDFTYRLVGVVIHRGRAGGGHYWSYIRNKRGENEQDVNEDKEEYFNSIKDWKEFNDETVKYYYAKNLE
jgi:ubiquitin C-terminal hydrolase